MLSLKNDEQTCVRRLNIRPEKIEERTILMIIHLYKLI